MLDLTKLAGQLEGISQHLAQQAIATRQRLDLASKLLQQAASQQVHLTALHQHWQNRLGFTAATPIESLQQTIDLALAPPNHTVLATDGSQIAPSHHEIAYCYLINVGRVVLHYGQNRHPLLDSLPEVFYRTEDLYASRQWGVSTEEWMGYRRTTAEAIVLAELATLLHPNTSQDHHQMSLLEATPSAHPHLGMVDGSLIYWFLDPLPGEARDCILQPILAAWEQLRQLKIPLVGYVSASRSGESINFLRLQACPHNAPDCLTHCEGKVEQAPCQVLDPLRDTALWERLLKPGQRSPIWRSSAQVLEAYGPHHIYFCYVHVGAEIARLEFPAWVVKDPKYLETALSLTLTQVQKGYGYPVALAEAHNQAVVRGSDRSRFFALLEQQMIRAGLKNVGTSYKEARKRGSIA